MGVYTDTVATIRGTNLRHIASRAIILGTHYVSLFHTLAMITVFWVLFSCFFLPKLAEDVRSHVFELYVV